MRTSYVVLMVQHPNAFPDMGKQIANHAWNIQGIESCEVLVEGEHMNTIIPPPVVPATPKFKYNPVS